MAWRVASLPSPELVLLCRHASYTLDLFFHQYTIYKVLFEIYSWKSKNW